MLTDAILMSLNTSKYFSKETITLDYKDYPNIENFRSTDKKLIDELGKFFNYKHNRKRGIESTFEIDCLYIKFFEKICQPKWRFTLKKLRELLNFPFEIFKKNISSEDYKEIYENLESLSITQEEPADLQDGCAVAGSVWIESMLKINYINKVISFVYKNNLHDESENVIYKFAESLSHIKKPNIQKLYI